MIPSTGERCPYMHPIRPEQCQRGLAGAAQRASHSRRQRGPRTRCRAALDEADAGTSLATEFSQHINKAGLHRPLAHRSPTPMLSPTAAVAAQMDALQMNNWPEADAGIRTAFLFSKPYGCESMIAGRATPSECHSWQGSEQWVPFETFSAALHAPPMHVLLGCESWKPASNLIFPSQRHSNKAVQAVQVQAWPVEAGGQLQSFTFTFCMERIDEGPYKGCWMTVGLRSGNYSV